MTLDFSHISEQLISFSLLIPVIFFFIKRLIDIRDRNESELRSQIIALSTQLRDLETRLTVLSREMKSDYMKERVEKIEIDIVKIKRNMNRKNHWFSNALMKINSKLYNIDKTDINLG